MGSVRKHSCRESPGRAGASSQERGSTADGWGEAEGSRLGHTMTIIQELCEVYSTAGGPGQRLVHVDEEWRHHVVLAHGPKQPGTGLRIIMGHAENVPWVGRGAGGREQRTVVHSSCPHLQVPCPACMFPMWPAVLMVSTVLSCYHLPRGMATRTS